MSLASHVMGTVESRRMHQMHLVKLGVNKGVRTWDPQGCVWVRISTEGDVLHRQKQDTKSPPPRVEVHIDDVPSVSFLTPKLHNQRCTCMMS